MSAGKHHFWTVNIILQCVMVEPRNYWRSVQVFGNYWSMQFTVDLTVNAKSIKHCFTFQRKYSRMINAGGRNGNNARYHKHLTQITYITHFNNVVIQKWRISLDILYYLTNESRYVEYNKLFSGALYFFSVSYIMVLIGSSFCSQL